MDGFTSILWYSFELHFNNLIVIYCQNEPRVRHFYETITLPSTWGLK